MKFLLDTHAFLWWCMGGESLPDHVRELIADSRNEAWFSVAGAWEIAIKTACGRLMLPEEPAAFVKSRLRRHHLSVLPVRLEHALAVAGLPDHHADPFDRLLVVQSRIEGLPLVTCDAAIRRYGIDTIW